MSFKPTKMQEKAIFTDGSLLVAAAAGSGKTAVLVERVIRKLTDRNSPISADRLLIVTFTNAAAAEMRTRIEKRLDEECLKNPNDSALIRQRRMLPFAKICTIDSFCIELVRENFESCGVEPDFTVGDGSSLEAVSNNVLTEIIEKQLENGSNEFVTLLELFGCEYDERNLTDMIRKIYLYGMQLPFPYNFFESLATPYKTDFGPSNIWYTKAFERAEELLKRAKRYSSDMSESAELLTKNSEKCLAYASDITSLLEELYKICSRREWNEFFAKLRASAIGRLPSTDKEDSTAAVFKERKKQISDTLSRLQNMFSHSAEDMQKLSKKLRPAIELLIKMLCEYSTRLLEEYKKENTFTFSDIEQFALSLLCGHKDGAFFIRPEAEELISTYDEIMVDEFQDVNDLQNMLFYVLSDREKKLFVVGDVKQSIYGFRGSNPENFLRKKNAYKDIGEALPGDSAKIILADNFRSRSGVCDYVNFFFSLMMCGQTGSLVYNDEEYLRCAASFPQLQKSDVQLLITTGDDMSGDEGRRSEARCIADYIRRTMQEGAVIRSSNGELRNAQYSDFVILLGTMQGKAELLSKELSACGIPVVCGGGSYSDTTEVATTLALLKIIDNPGNDVELLTVMMCPIFGFSADEMAFIRAGCRRGGLYSAVIAAAESGDKHCREFIDALACMRRDAAVTPIAGLISKIIYDTDYLGVVSAMPSGSARRRNLLLLIDIASNFSSGGRADLSAFIQYVKTMPDKAVTAANSAENKVRIMSMHASKGLQFPVCIVAGLASRFNRSDSVSRVLFSESNGITFKYYDEQQQADVEMLGHRLGALDAYVNTVDERLRLLYVAMTRAEDRLALVCSCSDPAARLNKIAQQISKETPRITDEWISSTSSMQDWVLAASLLHPDGEMLRRLSDSPIAPAKAMGRFEVQIVSPDANLSEEKISASAPIADIGLAQSIEKNLGYEYPFEPLKDIRAKCSVSDIAHKAEARRYAFTERPAFMQKDGLSAAGRGTAMHHIMQFINMDDSPDVDSEIERLVEYEYITQAEADAADKEAIKRFFADSVFTRILNSKDVRREMRFITAIKAGELSPDLPQTVWDEEVMVQGAVDMCFAEDDGIVVLDFKSDRVDNTEQLIASYSEQLSIYCTACEKIFGLPVKEKIIYSFALGKAISF